MCAQVRLTIVRLRYDLYLAFYSQIVLFQFFKTHQSHEKCAGKNAWLLTVTSTGFKQFEKGSSCTLKRIDIFSLLTKSDQIVCPPF